MPAMLAAHVPWTNSQKKEVVVGLVALKILWGGFSGSYHIVILGYNLK